MTERRNDGSIVAVVNNKGGVGKTTSAVNLAAGITAGKRRVLLVDLDAQGSAFLSLGPQDSPREPDSFPLGERGPGEGLSTLQGMQAPGQGLSPWPPLKNRREEAMSYCKELFCISFDSRNNLRYDPLLPGKTYGPGTQTRYQAWAHIKDLFGHPYRIDYAQVNVIHGDDDDTPSKRDSVRKLVHEALEDYSSLFPKEPPILFVPPEPIPRL